MLEFIQEGGWALWIILGCSIVMFGIIFERLVTMRRADIDADDFLDKVSQHIEQRDVSGAMGVCALAGGPVADTIAIGLRKLVFLERIGKKPEEIEEGIVGAMEDHGGHVINWLERNLTLLATIASLGPILGMMGTVIGMIEAFEHVAAMGNMTPAAVASGIAKALHCTAGGLFIAAIATVAYNYFTARVNRFALQVQAAGTQLVERILDAQAGAPNQAAARPAASKPAPPAMPRPALRVDPQQA